MLPNKPRFLRYNRHTQATIVVKELMSNSTFSLMRDVDFLFEIGTLRYHLRTWNQFLNPNAQSLTEHTFRVAWIAMVIAKHEGITDISKVMKMALIHDIGESRSVDVNYLSRQYADRHEHQAANDTLDGTSLCEDFMSYWHEYEDRQSLEAKIVKDADILEVELELKELEAMGNTLREALSQSRQNVVEEKLFTESGKKMWHEIQNADPHNWHLAVRMTEQVDPEA